MPIVPTTRKQALKLSKVHKYARNLDPNVPENISDFAQELNNNRLSKIHVSLVGNYNDVSGDFKLFKSQLGFDTSDMPVFKRDESEAPIVEAKEDISVIEHEIKPKETEDLTTFSGFSKIYQKEYNELKEFENNRIDELSQFVGKKAKEDYFKLNERYKEELANVDNLDNLTGLEVEKLKKNIYLKYNRQYNVLADEAEDIINTFLKSETEAEKEKFFYPEVIGKDKMNELQSEVLDENFMNSDHDERQDLIHDGWNKLFGELAGNSDITKEQLSKAKNEYYGNIVGELMAFDAPEPTVYQMKSYAEDLLKTINEKISEADKNKDKYVSKRELATIPGEYTLFTEGMYADELSVGPDLAYAKDMLEKLLRTPDNQSTAIKSFYKGLVKNDVIDYIPFIGAVNSIASNLSTYQVAKKAEQKKPMDDDEVMLLQSYGALSQLNQVKPKSTAYNVGSAVGEMLPYIGEFALTLGAFTYTSATIENALNVAVKKGINKFASKALAYSIGSLAQTTVNPQQYIDRTIERMTPEMNLMLSDDGGEALSFIDSSSKENFGEAFAKAYGETYSEFFTENLGGAFKSLGKWKSGSKAFGNFAKKNEEWVKRTVLGNWMRKKGFKNVQNAVNDIAKRKLGWHGIFEEYGEEFINTRMSDFITGDYEGGRFKSLLQFDKERELETFLTVGLVGGVLNISNKAGRLISGNNLRFEYTENGEKKSTKMPVDIFSSINSELTADDINAKKIRETIEGSGLNRQQKKILYSIASDEIRQRRIDKVKETEKVSKEVPTEKVKAKKTEKQEITNRDKLFKLQRQEQIILEKDDITNKNLNELGNINSQIENVYENVDNLLKESNPELINNIDNLQKEKTELQNIQEETSSEIERQKAAQRENEINKELLPLLKTRNELRNDLLDKTEVKIEEPVKEKVKVDEKFIVESTPEKISQKEEEKQLIELNEKATINNNVVKSGSAPNVKTWDSLVEKDMAIKLDDGTYKMSPIKTKTTEEGFEILETQQEKYDSDLSQGSPRRYHYDALESGEGRTKISPKKGELKPIFEILENVASGLEANVFFAKMSRKGISAEYSPSSAAIVLRNSSSLDDAAHDLGHFLSDNFKLNSKIKDNENAINEISDYWSFGSEPPVNHPDPFSYKIEEGIAEFMRAYFINPDQVKIDSPELTKIYESNIDQGTKEILNEFSSDLRAWAEQPELSRQISNMRMNNNKLTILDKFKRLFNKEGLNEASLKFASNWLNQYIYSEEGFRTAMDIQGIKSILPVNDFIKLQRLMSGHDVAFNNMMEHGLVDFNYKRILDSGGDVKSWKWLFEPLKDMKSDQVSLYVQKTIGYMVAQRTIEIVEQKLPERQVIEDLKNDKLPSDAVLENHERILNKKAFEDKTYEDVINELKNKNTKTQPDSRYNFENATISGVGGGMISDYTSAQKAVKEFELSKEYDKNGYDAVKEMADRYREYADDVLKVLVDSGRISQENYDEIKETNSYYVSFSRLMEAQPGEDISIYTRGSKGKIGVSTEVIKKIKGGGKKMEMAYVSLMEGTYKTYREARRNHAMLAFREMLLSDRKMGEGEVLKLADIGRIAKQGDPQTIPIYVDGKAEYWQFEKDIYESMKGMHEFGKYIPEVFTWYASLIRKMIVTAPQFLLKNRERDLLSRFVIGAGTVGYKDFINRKKFREKFELFGGGQFGYHLTNKESYFDYQDRTLKEISKDKSSVLDIASGGFKKLGNFYDNVLSKSEMATRIEEMNSVYRKMKSKGMDDLNAYIEAAYQSRDLLDFAVIGNKARALNKIYPFTNAHIQGIRKLINRVKYDPVSFFVKLGTYAILTELSQALLISSLGDDKKREYNKLSWYRRDLFYHIPYTKGRWITIPKPFEVGVISSGIGRIFDITLLNADPKDIFDSNYFRHILLSFMIIDPDVATTGFITPFGEIKVNYDPFRDKHIIPPYEEKADVEYRKGTEYASRLGNLIQSISFDTFDARFVDHIIKGLFGYYGDMAVRISNIGRKDTNDQFNALLASGVVKAQSVYGSKDVQWLLKGVEKFGKSSKRTIVNRDDYKGFQYLMNSYFKEENAEKKKKLGYTLLEYSENLRKYYEKELFPAIVKVKRQKKEFTAAQKELLKQIE